MHRIFFLSAALLMSFVSALQSIHAQEITLKTVLETSASAEQFALKINAPKGTSYHIDWGDGSAIQDKQGTGGNELLFHSFQDMAAVAQHQVKVWGAQFVEFMVISNKKVTEIALKDCNELEKFSCANSLLRELDLSACPKLSSVICNGNDIAMLKVPESVKTINFKLNRLSLSNFPQKRTGMLYTYGPMRPVKLANEKVNGLTVDLTEMLEFNGKKSTFKWYCYNDKGNNADPALLISPETYVEKDGVFSFNQSPGKPIYCVVANEELPALNNINDCYGIMPIEISGEIKKLEQVHAAFVTDKFTTEGLTFDLTLAANEADSRCTIDWGDGTFEETVIGTSETVLKHHFIDAKVDKQHTVQVECGNLVHMRLPEVGGFIKFAPTTVASPVKRISLDNNRVENIDFSVFVNVEDISANGCYMKQVTLPANCPLKKLSLRGGTLTELNLNAYTGLEELNLSLNALKTLDLSAQSNLKIVDVSHNRLKSIAFAPRLSSLDVADCSYNALPMYMLPEKGAMTTYRYAPQEAFEITSDLIDGCTVDLSKFNNLKGVATTPQPTSYIWLHGDDESKFIVETVHYDVENGVFKFKFNEPTKVFCTIQTAAFPDLASNENSYRTKNIVVPAQEEALVNATVIETPLHLTVTHRMVNLRAYQKVHVEIFSIEGKEMWTKTLAGGEDDVIELEQGVYIVRAEGLKPLKFMVW